MNYNENQQSQHRKNRKIFIVALIVAIIFFFYARSERENDVVEGVSMLLPLITVSAVSNQAILDYNEEIAIQEQQEYREEIIANQINYIVKEVPSRDTSRKSYMGYRAITSRGSLQHRLQHSGEVTTDNNGFRRLGDSYVVAMGTYYGLSGDKLTIELENGKVFDVVIGDTKQNRHTDAKNQYCTSNGSVLEFIVDQGSLHSLSKKMGDVSYADGLDGNIKNIKFVNGNNFFDN